MDQLLKTKNISDVPGQISCCQWKYLVKDTNNEFTECQTPRKKFQSIGISPVCLHPFTKTLKSSVSEAQKVQVRLNVLVRLQEAMQEKLILFRTNPISYLGT